MSELEIVRMLGLRTMCQKQKATEIKNVKIEKGLKGQNRKGSVPEGVKTGKGQIQKGSKQERV